LKRRSVVGLGANLGDRLGAMQTAVREIERAGHFVDIVSRVYATAPVGGPPQGEFLNAAVLILHDGPATDLMDTLLEVERGLGRVRGPRWGPRTIDLDLLWIEGLLVEAPTLTVPHPHLRERAFAVAPLLDVVPDARDPRTGERYALPAGDIRVTSHALR
jgi:2-amino-4-hydroxy-6-hydroxymethyldihydropteridine diphosphokinase